MKAKRLFFVLLLALLLIPAAALAVDYTVSDGQTFNLNVCSSATSDTVTVAANATATLTGSATGVPVSCEAGVTLTISGVSIDTSASGDTCALSFTGTGNTLILSGDNTLKSGENEPGLRAEGTTELLIYGEGSLDATGGENGAGIGGGEYSNCCIMTISGGTIKATGGECGAGIGGGYYSSPGTLEISGGAVEATGGLHGAGIGGGDLGGGGDIVISGGTVKAYGGIMAAGIGGGCRSGIGNVTISGGMVEATGGSASPGIGAGPSSNSIKIIISGGLVYAKHGHFIITYFGERDIGAVFESHIGPIIISQTAAVFLENNDTNQVTLPDNHVNKTYSDAVNPMIFDSNNEVYGLTVPSAWTTAQGGYFRFSEYTIVYDANGGGTPPDSPVHHIGTTVTVTDDGGLTRFGYAFSGWNTLPDGNGVTYAAGTKLTLTSSITLYAIWREIPRTGDDHATSVYILAGLAFAALLGMSAVTTDKRKRRTYQ